MRVLMVTPSYYPIVGGTETYVQQLTHELNQKGIIADIMTFNMDSKWGPTGKNEIEKDGEFNVYKISAHDPRFLAIHGHSPHRELFNVHLIPRLNFSKQFKMYDIIHFHDDIDLSFPFFSYLLGARGKPRLLHCHSLPYTYRSYKRNYLSGAFLRKVADLYVALSKYTVRLLLDLGLPQNKVTILPNAVDTVAFRPTGNKAENTVLYAARITPQKGLDVLLKALFYLDVQTHVIVTGPVGDRLFFTKIEYLMQKVIKETPHTITYLGCVDKSTLIDCHQKASVFVCSSIFDHFPISNLEAMACGTPVVGTNVGAVPEVIEDGVSGIMVPPNDPKALAIALRGLLVDKRKREAYGKNARRIVEESFSWHTLLGRLTRTYADLAR